ARIHSTRGTRAPATSRTPRIGRAPRRSRHPIGMRIIGVLDLLRGRAVHARAGDRGHYEPVRVAAGSAVGMGDAIALARVYVERLGIDELYVADLDALTGGRVQDALIADVAALGAPFLLDAAVTSVAHARHAVVLGAAHVIVALETLQSYDVIREIC